MEIYTNDKRNIKTAKFKGFTLVEMLCVLAVLGLMVGLASVTLSGSIEKVKFNKEIEGFIRVLKMAHNGASESTYRYMVTVNIEDGTYQLQTLPAMPLEVFTDTEKRTEYLEEHSNIITEGVFSDRCYIDYVVFDDGTNPTDEGYAEAVLYAGKNGWSNAVKIVFLDLDDNVYSLITNRLNSEVQFVKGDIYLPEPMSKQDVRF